MRWRSYLVLLILLHSNLRFRNQRTKRSCHDFHVIERFYLTTAMHFCLFLVNFCYHHFSHATLAFAHYPCSHHALSLIWNRRHSYIMIHITTFFWSRLWYVYVFLAKWSSNKGCTYAITTMYEYHMNEHPCPKPGSIICSLFFGVIFMARDHDYIIYSSIKVLVVSVNYIVTLFYLVS